MLRSQAEVFRSNILWHPLTSFSERACVFGVILELDGLEEPAAGLDHHLRRLRCRVLLLDGL